LAANQLIPSNQAQHQISDISPISITYGKQENHIRLRKQSPHSNPTPSNNENRRGNSVTPHNKNFHEQSSTFAAAALDVTHSKLFDVTVDNNGGGLNKTKQKKGRHKE
jgi:hypothetical protein